MLRFHSFISIHFSLKPSQLVLVWETHAETLTLTNKEVKALLRTTFKNHQNSGRKWRECQLVPSGCCYRLQRQHCSGGLEAFPAGKDVFVSLISGFWQEFSSTPQYCVDGQRASVAFHLNHKCHVVTDCFPVKAWNFFLALYCQLSFFLYSCMDTTNNYWNLNFVLWWCMFLYEIHYTDTNTSMNTFYH